MEWTVKNRLELSFSWLEIQGAFIGSDFVLCVQGGEKPHIGCTVMAVPRPSPKGEETLSATSSVMNLTGHKDEAICRLLAETAAKRLGAVVVCTGGFHVDHITAEQIAELMDAVEHISW